MIEKFNGFTPDTFQFLRTLCDNNKKEWFVNHKPDYEEYLFKPMQALAAGLGSFMLSIDHEFEVAPVLNRTISRIYRDTRFSKDKSPYKTSHWITFKRSGNQWKDYPAFFFELSPYSYRYGLGFYSASRQTMDTFRKSIDGNTGLFLSAVSFYQGQDAFKIEGDEYKRPLRADMPSELREWYNRKNLCLISNLQIEGNCIDKKLMSEIMCGFKVVEPLYHYLCKVADYK